MKGYVLSKMTGGTHPKGVVVPKLYDYMKNFEIKGATGPDVDSWCVCIVDDAAEIPPAAEADAHIFVADTEAELDTVLSSARRDAINNKLASEQAQSPSDPVCAVRVVSGDTVRVFLDKIRQALGHTAESWGLAL